MLHLLAQGGWAEVGVPVAVTLAAIELAKAAVSKLSNGKPPKPPADYYDRTQAFMSEMKRVHLGPGALDMKTGVPTWWGTEIVKLLKDIRDKAPICSSCPAIKRYEEMSDRFIEMQRESSAALDEYMRAEGQRDEVRHAVLLKLAERLEKENES